MLKCLTNDEAWLTWLVIRKTFLLLKWLCSAALETPPNCIRWGETFRHTFHCKGFENIIFRMLRGKLFVLMASSICSNVESGCALCVLLLTRPYATRDLDERIAWILWGRVILIFHFFYFIFYTPYCFVYPFFWLIFLSLFIFKLIVKGCLCCFFIFCKP